MSPTLSQDWVSCLKQLEENWDGCGAVPVSERAVQTLLSAHVVPKVDGGIQLYLSSGDRVVEMEISSRGEILCVSMEIDKQTVAK